VLLLTTQDQVAQTVAGVAGYGGSGARPEEVSVADRERILAQAPKRVGLRFHVTRAVTWDHRKLS